ncbi:MAG: tryptophan synthase subunit alpha [Candidatus Lokiarchaeota archaeon]|nr:tryptophan synthase subunit alpha [Candidatus Lokiarchaeota archaeon]
MNRLEKVFEGLDGKGECAFVPFLVAGDPDPGTFTRLARAIEPHADILEFGIPYTDPIADGEVIQAADARALASGTTFSKACDLIAGIRRFTEKPIVVLTYANVVGVGRVMGESLATFDRAGVDGLIIADVPAEEARPYKAAIEQHGMDLISLVAPTTTDERLEAIAGQARGFLYLVALKGVTGARVSLLEETRATVQRAAALLGGRKHVPVCVGFGISSPEHVSEVVSLGASGAIVGSAIVDIIGKYLQDKDLMITKMERFTSDLKNATRKTSKIKG